MSAVAKKSEITLIDGAALVSTEAAAKFLGISTRTIRRMDACRDITPVWVRGAKKYRAGDLLALAKAKR